MEINTNLSQAEPNFLSSLAAPTILQQLDALIKGRSESLIDPAQQSGDSTGDWVALNFLSSIRCESLGLQALNQLNVILRGWISSSPPSVTEFGAMLQGLRAFVAEGR